MGRARDDERRDLNQPPPANRALQGLARLKARLPEQHGSSVGEEPVDSGSKSGSATGRVLVYLERKGRAGKQVTRVSGLPGENLEQLSRELRKALGVGSTLEGADLLLQGDVRDRVVRVLQDRDLNAELGN